MQKRHTSASVRRLRSVLLGGGILLLAAALLVSAVSGAWTEIQASGDWTIRTREIFQGVDGQNNGAMTWQNLSNVDFAGYHAVWNFSYLLNTPNWWDVESQKNVIIEWNFSGIYVYASAKCLHNLGSLIHNDWLYGGSATNQSQFTGSWWDFTSAGTVRTHVNFQEFDSFEIFVSKKDATTVLVELWAMRLLADVRLFSNEHTVSADYWDTVDVTYQVWHEGPGHFLGAFSDEIFTASYSPDVPSGYIPGEDNPFSNFFGNLLNTFSKVLPSYLRDMLTSFSGWFVWLIPIASVVWGVVTQLAPLLPFILLFYLIDVCFSSVKQGSFQPIGQMTVGLFNLASTIVGAVVSIAGTIYDFIHFW